MMNNAFRCEKLISSPLIIVNNINNIPPCPMSTGCCSRGTYIRPGKMLKIDERSRRNYGGHSVFIKSPEW